MKTFDTKKADAEIRKAIEQYLKARKKIRAIGRKYPGRIGGNDNIIGRIGEFIALRLLESMGQRPSKVKETSNPEYDLVVGKIKIQVKVITAENKVGKTVRLKEGWDQFLLIELGENYKPERIGLLCESQHKTARNENPRRSENPVAALTMLDPTGLIGRYGKVYKQDEIPEMFRI